MLCSTEYFAISQDHIGLISEGMLQNILGQKSMRRNASAAEKSKVAARIVAEAMRQVNIRVISSSDIGGSIPVLSLIHI